MLPLILSHPRKSYSHPLSILSLAESCKRTVNGSTATVLGSRHQLTRHRTGITLRIAATPIPGVADDRLQIGEARVPPKVFADALARRDQDRRIAGAAGPQLDRNFAAGNAGHRLDHFTHRVAAAISQVVAAAPLVERRQHADMGVRQIGNMDVIPDAGA